MKSTAAIIMCLPVALMMVASPVRADGIVVEDPIGDAVCHNSAAPGYLDIVAAELEKADQVYLFSTTVAAPIPDEPAMSKGVKEIFWTWGIDSDPTTAPLGAWPLPPGYPTIVEFHIVVLWNGQGFRAVLADHRPLLVGEEQTLWDIPYSREGTELSVTIQDWMLGDIEGFVWGASTSVWTKNMQPENNPDWSASFFVVDGTVWVYP